MQQYMISMSHHLKKQNALHIVVFFFYLNKNNICPSCLKWNYYLKILDETFVSKSEIFKKISKKNFFKNIIIFLGEEKDHSQ